ncbi:double zinc ribbon and ankyrin repeat-containing protein 1 [Periophthalmus magnuspinnatus]|uniref:double zinc ribbon and ankyrin repeat-containing protein 1 n=1 Tax=Periophthalmus magnuspinnatus TaxID=409849 RepID=UPI00145B3319|nr:double zinc ribbon and ankyrin repeat-containing protein 1 [Periophthalmus magnuspinnatus]
MAGSISAPLVLPLIPPTQKHKNHIQTCTRVCLQTESPDAEIFFTLDGSKPNSRSRKYTAPITLPPGRVCVRAQAQSRESLIVTKFFTVDDVTYDTTSDPANDSPALITLTNQSEAHLTPVPPSHLRSLLANSRPATPTSDQKLKMKRSPPPGPEDSIFLKTLSRTEKNRIQRDTDFMRCPECLGVRPSDPAAVFCPLCGARLSAVPAAAPPPETAQMMSCVFCRSPVPVRSESCFVCDAPLALQLQPQSSLHLSVSPPPVCKSSTCLEAPPLCACGAAGPAHSSCVLCDSACCRTERRSGPCGRCGAFTPTSASFCSTCGFRATPTERAATNQAPPTAEQSTQTVGLYFPSATALRTKPDQNQDQNQDQRRPRPSGISPGRGFWRQQVDHVCAHLRSHAQNHAPFRTLLGEPRLGRLVSAVVHEDPQEVTLTLSFSSVTPVTPVTTVTTVTRPARAAPAGGELQTLSSITEGLTKARELGSSGQVLYRGPGARVLGSGPLQRPGSSGPRVRSSTEARELEGSTVSLLYGNFPSPFRPSPA